MEPPAAKNLAEAINDGQSGTPLSTKTYVHGMEMSEKRAPAQATGLEL
jgi:hypothetical protein